MTYLPLAVYGHIHIDLRKYELVMVNNFSNEDKTNSYLSPQIIEHNSHYDEYPSSGLERPQQM